MKVLLISSGSGSRGGGEIYLRYLAEGLSGLGCDVHLLLAADAVMNELAEGAATRATVHRLPLTNTFRRATRSLGAVIDLEQRRRVCDFIGSIAPDVVHINQQVAEDGLDLLLAAADAGAPFVSTIHVTQSASELGARMGALRDLVAGRVLARLAPPLIVVSKAAAARLVRRPRLASASVTVIHPAVRAVEPTAAAAARRRARREWSVPDGSVVIGTAGRIERQKNPLFLVDLLADLVASGRDCRLVWIGGGALRATLERRAEERGVRDRLLVEGWRDDARLRLAGLDVFAMPSRFEGLPLALVEAMHAGCAVCVSNVDGMPEAVTDGHDGVVLPLSEPESWRERVGAMVEAPALRSRYAAAARETARARFGIEAMAGATLATYRRAGATTAPTREPANAG